MSVFFLRKSLRNILTTVRETLETSRANLREVRLMNVNLTAAVDSAVTLINAQGAKIVSLEAQIAAFVDDSAAEQAEADKLTAAINANPIPA